MALFRPVAQAMLLLLLAGTAAAQYTNYFSNQRFSGVSGTTGGTFNGGTYTLSNTAGSTITTFTAAPGSLPSGSGFPSTGPSALTLNSGTGFKTITISFSTPLTPADHIYVEDMDNSEVANFSFYDSGSALIDPRGFRASTISTNFNPGFTMGATSTAINISGGSPTVTEPLLEMIPNTLVSSIQLNFNNPNSGGFAIYFGRNIPVLSQTLSGTTITRGRSLKLTYALNGINNNPIYDLSLSNTLPAGWKVAAVPDASSSVGTLNAASNASSVSVSGVNNAFAATNGRTSATWSFDVTNADGQMNSSCSGNPAAFSNQAANFTTSTTVLTNSVTPVCFTVTAPLPVDLQSFRARPDACAAMLHWETAYEELIRGYEIERSTDGQLWESAGFVSSGNARQAQLYSFRDASAPQGSLVYRLRIHDLSGASTYSPVSALRLACADISAALTFFPNPASSTVSCNLPAAPKSTGQLRLQVTDLAGRSVACIPAESLSGTVAQFGLPSLAPGLYIVHAVLDGRLAGSGKLNIR